MISLAAVFAFILSPVLSASVASDTSDLHRRLTPTVTSRSEEPITTAEVATIFHAWTTGDYTTFFASVDPNVRWMLVSDAKVKSMELSGVYVSLCRLRSCQ